MNNKNVMQSIIKHETPIIYNKYNKHQSEVTICIDINKYMYKNRVPRRRGPDPKFNLCFEVLVSP